jgi:predicted transcriptional regulator
MARKQIFLAAGWSESWKESYAKLSAEHQAACEAAMRVHVGLQHQNSYSPTSRMTLRGGTMKTVILDVRTPSESMGDFLDSWKTGKPQGSARISFATPELLWQVLTAKRWQLLKALCGAGPVSIREAARRVHRDVKAVHGDVTALLNAGVLDRAEGGGIVFPFDAVKVEFLLKAA